MAIWMQPKSQDELLARLADACDLNMPERERENLCACESGKYFSERMFAMRSEDNDAWVTASKRSGW